MSDAFLTALEMDARVPADHPLRVLARASTEPLEATIARLLALDTGLSRLTLQRALRAALLQSLYGIADYSNFADQIHFNALFRWFIGLENSEQPWDSAAYADLHKRWTNDQELRQFLELVVTNAARLDPSEADEVIKALELWLNRFCPKTVYFHQFAKSPIRDVRALLRFRDSNDRLAETDLQPKFWQKLHEFFPAKRDPDEAILSGEQDWQELRTNDTYTSVTLNSGAAFIISVQPGFESWEDSFKPYLSTVIDAYQAIQPTSQVEQAVLGFNNRLYLPAEIELSDYFHTLPAAPPNVVPPRFMRDNNLAYAFPARVMKGSYSTDLLYDSGSHFLRCSFELEPTQSGLQVDLDLELHWHRPFMIEAAISIFDGMKNNLYVAFHSLITDQTRALFQ